MIWPFRNRQTDDILERAAEPLWKVEPPRPWPDPPERESMSPVDLNICCRSMTRAMGENRVQLKTHKVCGNFVWELHSPQLGIMVCNIDFCPWCGVELKGSMDSVAEKLAPAESPAPKP